MAMPGDRGDHQGRVDLFHPSSLTHEEAELLKKLRFESAWKRGYPLAILCGGLTAMGTRRFSTPARIALTSVGCIVGNIVGKISYLPTIYGRLMSDLPDSSPLRQKIETLKKDSRGDFAGNFPYEPSSQGSLDHNVQFDTGSEYGSDNMEPHEESTVTQPKKFVTYEELRERNRKGSPVSPKTDEFGSFGQMLSTTPSSDVLDDVSQGGDMRENEISGPKPPVRYNKYGDPIIE